MLEIEDFRVKLISEHQVNKSQKIFNALALLQDAFEFQLNFYIIDKYGDVIPYKSVKQFSVELNFLCYEDLIYILHPEKQSPKKSTRPEKQSPQKSTRPQRQPSKVKHCGKCGNTT